MGLGYYWDNLDQFKFGLGGLLGRQTPACAPNPIPSQSYIQPASLRQRLDIALKQAEERMAQLQHVQEILDQNPDIEKLLEIVQKGYF